MADRPYADRIPAPRPVPTTRQRLTDARACGHTPEQHRHDDGQAADAASHDRAIRELTADRDHWRRELDNLHEAYARATTEREQARNAVKTVTAERDGLRDDIQRVEQTRQEQVAELRQRLDTMTEAATDHRKTSGCALSDRDRYARTAANLLAQRNEAASQVELITGERDQLVETIARLVSLPPEQIANMHKVGYSGGSADDTAPEVTLVEPECDGLCVSAADIGVGRSDQIAYPHPSCPLHAPGEVCQCGQPDRCLSPTHRPDYAPLGSPSPRAQDASAAAQLLRQAAAGRREYAKGIPEKAEPLELQAHTLDAAACVVEGDLGPLYDWLPSWQWTGEMNARLHPERRG